MRLIDADELHGRLMKRYMAHNLDDTRDMAARAAIMSCMEAVERSKTITIEQPQNKPLSLEELWEMDGEPVYVQYLSITGEYGLVKTYGREFLYIRFIDGISDVVGKHGLFSIGAKIYRRKPEGDAK